MGTLIAMLSATAHGYRFGQVNMLTAPIDASNNFCGFGAMEGYPKMMLTRFIAQKPLQTLKSGVCLKECPRNNSLALVDGKNCRSNMNAKCSDRASYKSRDLMDFCLPWSKDALNVAEREGYNDTLEELKNSQFGSIFQEMYRARISIFITIGCSVVWSMLYIQLMSIFAEAITWLSIILI